MARGQRRPRAVLRRRPLDGPGRRPAPRALRDRLRGLLRLQRHRRQLAGAGLAVPELPLHHLPRDRPRRDRRVRRAGVLLQRHQGPHRRRASTARSTPPAVDWAVRRRTDIHYPKPRVVSLTQATELGTVYTPDELQAVWRPGQARTACASTWTAPASPTPWPRSAAPPSEITWQAGVDVLCFGGTKNGMAVGEAVVFFDRELAARVRLPLQAGRPARLQDALPGRALGRHAARTAPGCATPRHANAMAALLHGLRDGRPRRRGRSTRGRPTASSSSSPPAVARRPARARLALLRLHRLGRGAAHVLLGHHRGGRAGLRARPRPGRGEEPVGAVTVGPEAQELSHCG